jgi:hypothetical protein
MEKEIDQTQNGLASGEDKDNSGKPVNLKRREALKRIAALAAGTITGAIILDSCIPYIDYSDYSDYYSNYYSDYYSRYYSDYYDYYSVYSVYWDAR